MRSDNGIRSQAARLRGHRRRGGHAGPHLRRSGRDQNDDRAYRTGLWIETRPTCGRHRVGYGQIPRLASGHRHHTADWDKSNREDGTFSRSDFTFDRDRNVYVCPADKLLKTTGNVGATTWRATVLPSSTAAHAHSKRDRALGRRSAVLSKHALAQGHTRPPRGRPRSCSRPHG
jgi:hypothetical protein